MNNKNRYREFCKTEQSIPIFSKDWWLDAVCGENNWDVVLVEKGGQIVATMPYYIKHKMGLKLIVQPLLTQHNGPYLKYPKGQKYYKKLSWEKKLIDELIEQLPHFDSFSQNFSHMITNYLSFYWKGFQQTTRYTYIIENISLEDLEKNFETDIRRRRRKAEKMGVKVFESDDIEIFYKLNKMTFDRQGKKIPYSIEFIKNFYQKVKTNNACKMYFAKDNYNNIIAANFLVYDDTTVYYLMGGIEPTKKDLGGMDVVQFESIKFALQNGKRFDFEGSMIESIEKYFRSFGAKQVPYFAVSNMSRRMASLYYGRKLMHSLLGK